MFRSCWALFSCFAFYGEFLKSTLGAKQKEFAVASYAPEIPDAWTVNIRAPAPTEGLCTVEDRLQSCQTQILRRLVRFPVHGQMSMQINHFTVPVISLMGFHPWLCRLAPPREAAGRVHLFMEIEISRAQSDSGQVQTLLVSASDKNSSSQLEQPTGHWWNSNSSSSSQQPLPNTLRLSGF